MNLSINPHEILRALYMSINYLRAAQLEALSIEMHPWTWSELVKMAEFNKEVTSGMQMVFGFPVILSEDFPPTKARVVVEVDLPLMALPSV